MLGHSPISSAPISTSPGPSGTYTFQTLTDTVSGTPTLIKGRWIDKSIFASDVPPVLGLTMDGVDNGTAFPEYRGKTVTVAGTVVTKTGVKQIGTASAYFDGSVSSNSLSVPASADYLFDADFTIEAWVYFSTNSGLSATRNVFGCSVSGTEYFLFAWNRANTRWGIWLNTTLDSSLGTWTPTVSTWYHVALVRSGTGTNNIKLYIDGTATGTAVTSAATIGYSDRAMYIGNWGGGGHFDGYIDDLAVYKGYAKYTANFTRPTTTFFKRYLTLSTTLAAPKVLPRVLSAKNAGPEVLALHMEGANGGTVFTDEIGKTVTVQGSAVTSTTQVKFGTTSAYFPSGTYNGLYAAASVEFLFAGDFTIEGWINFSDITGGVKCLFGMYRNFGLGDDRYFYLGYYPSNGWAVPINNASNTIMSTAVPTVGQWYHIALVRSGTSANNIRLYIDGVYTGTPQTSNASLGWSDVPFGVGFTAPGTANPHVGYIDDFVVYNGYAKYTANFTPPTSAFTLLPNEGIPVATQLVKQTKSFRIDTIPLIPKLIKQARRRMFPFTYVMTGFHMDGLESGASFPEVMGSTGTRGTSTVTSQAIKKYGTASCYFPGIYAPSASYLNFNNGNYPYEYPGDFTVEFWVNFELVPGAGEIATLVALPTPVGYFEIVYNGSTSKMALSLHTASPTDMTTTFTPTTFTWYHIALVRSGMGSNNVTLYVDGVSHGSLTKTITLGRAGFGGVLGRRGANTNLLTGYIDEFVIYRDFAKYTSSFTPPTGPFEVFTTPYGGKLTATAVKQVGKRITDTVSAIASLIADYLPISGTTFYQNVTDAVATTATAVRQVGKQVIDTVATVESITKHASKTVTDTVATIATLVASKTLLRTLTDTVAVAGLLIKQVGKFLTGTVTTAESLVRHMGKLVIDTVPTVATLARVKAFFRTLTDAVVSTATVLAQKAIFRTLSDAVAIVGSITKQVGKQVIAVITVAYGAIWDSGSSTWDGMWDRGTYIVRQVNKRTAYSLTALASLLTEYISGSQIFYQNVTDAVVTTATVTKQVGKNLVNSVIVTVTRVTALLKSVQDTVPITATIQTTKALLKSLTDTVATAASIVSSLGKNLSATVPVLASVIRSVGKLVTATTSLLASIVRAVPALLQDAVSIVASLTPVFSITRTLSAASSTVASASRTVGKAVASSAVGTATLSVSQVFMRTVSAAVATVATLIPTFVITRVLTAAVSTAASMLRDMFVTISAGIVAVPVKFAEISKALTVQVAALGTLLAEKLANSFDQAVNATVAVVASLTHPIDKLMVVVVAIPASVAKAIDTVKTTTAQTVAFLEAFFGISVLLTAATSFVSSLTTTAAKVAELLANVSISSTIDRLLDKLVAATSVTVGSVTKAMDRTFVATRSVVAVLKFGIARIAGYITSLSVFTKNDETVTMRASDAVVVEEPTVPNTYIFIDPDDDPVAKTQNRNVAK